MTVEDKFAIQELNHLYAYLIDIGAADRWANEVFTPDAVFDERQYDSGLFVGRAAIEAFGIDLEASVTHVVHHMTNHVITSISADAAIGVAFCICEVEAPDGRHERFNVIYEDEYAKADGGWKIAKRILVKTFDTERVGQGPANADLSTGSR